MRRRKTAELDDEALLDLVQRQTLSYFWDFAHPACGLARERSNVTPKYGLECVTTGGSGSYGTENGTSSSGSANTPGTPETDSAPNPTTGSTR